MDIKDKINIIKKRYGSSAETIIADGLSLTRKKNKYICYNSFKHNNNDKNPSLSWNKDKLYFNCMVCDFTIDIVGFLKDYKNMTYDDIFKEIDNNAIASTKSNTKSKPNLNSEKLTDLNTECISYLEKRKLDISIVKKLNNVKESDNKIAFIYTDSKKNIIGIKYRKPELRDKKKAQFFIKQVKDLNFYNQYYIPNINYIIITEGETDCLALLSCGIKNVVSVPTGANSLSKILDNESRWLNKFNKVIVLSDDDEAGNNMNDTFVSKLKNKVIIPDRKFWKKCNDINEILYKYGKKYINDFISDIYIKSFNILNLSNYDFNYDVDSSYYISTGFIQIDEVINDLKSGLLHLVVGKTGHGKSTLIEQIQINAIDKNYSVLRLDGEHERKQLIRNIYRKVLRRNKNLTYVKKENKKNIYEPTAKAIEILKEWHKDKLYIYNSTLEIDGRKKSEELFIMIEDFVKHTPIHLLIIDNLMSLNNFGSKDKYEAQTEFVIKSQELAKKYNICIILCVHPKKHMKNERNFFLDEYDISGTAEVPNYADIILSIEKTTDKELNDKGINGYFNVIKNRSWGETIKTHVNFDFDNKLLREIHYGNKCRIEDIEKMQLRGTITNYQLNIYDKINSIK